MDSLLLECAERLIARNFSIQAILSDAPRIRSWAQAHGILQLPAQDLVASDLAGLSCDYLFSVTWLQALPDFLLNFPRKAAINIQDSPLPRYSGPHGPAWALLEGERNYGVCWHLAGEKVGDGGLLQEVPVVIEPEDTSLSLNMKCFEAALQGFDALLDNLEQGSLATTPQDESRRVVFDLNQRPSHWGCMEWAEPASVLEARVRALNYGSYTNPFCLAKAFLGDMVVGVIHAVAETSQAEVDPGTILAASDRGLVVATADGNLRMLSLQSLQGHALGIEECMQRFGLRIGQVLASPHAGFLSGVTALLPDMDQSERTWVQRLMAGEPLTLAYEENLEQEPDLVSDSVAVEIPNSFLQAFVGEELRSAARTACLVHLFRISRQNNFRVRYSDEEFQHRVSGFESLLSPSVPLCIDLQPQAKFKEAMEWVDMQVAACRELPPFLHDLQARTMDTEQSEPLRLSSIGIVFGNDGPADGASLIYHFQNQELSLRYAANRFPQTAVESMAEQLQVLFADIAKRKTEAIGWLEILPQQLQQKMLVEWNDVALELPQDLLVHEMIAQKAQEVPEQTAVVAGDVSLSYQQLDSAADKMAAYLSSLGAGPDQLVGICMQRTTDMMVALLGVLKSGAAYLPLDPDFPPSRLRYMMDDSQVKTVLTDRLSSHLVEGNEAQVIVVEEGIPEVANPQIQRPAPSNLAYVIYTSGSTGNPKGVMLEHEQVCNFFLAMNERLGTEPGVWLAVTSLSFDISVLELLWTLTCGYKVVLFEGFDRGLSMHHVPAPHDAGQLEFSLMLWGASGGGPASPNPYRLMLDAARFADTHGFRSIWLPERHFHDFGGPYPNPAVAAAAIAAITERVGIRTGSVVLPLHNPVLMAEDWAMVDNLSGGRVALGIASGWHPNDFVLEPESYAERKQVMRKRMGILRSLWRGEALEMPNPIGENPEISTRPRPVQAELPLWLTAAGNPETFRLAGEMGVHVLTHLLGQNTNEIVEKIKIYRDAWREAGHPGSGHVTMMLHTMLGEDREEVREMARAPMCSYLATAADLLKDHMSAWAAVRTPMNRGKYETDFHLDELDPQDVQDLLDFAYDRYFETDALFGTPESCMTMIQKMRDLEVDEVACLVDFGAEPELILQQLPYLEQLRSKVQDVAVVAEGENMEDLIAEHKVTHLQCTPSMATMLLAEPAIAKALSTLEVMMVGGEALTEDLANQLRAIVPGRVMNMYGLTETAIWSSTADIFEHTREVSLGQPLANNFFYVLDEQQQLVPLGLPGELYIGGLGVARGYWGREDLTSEVFVTDPFTNGARRMYRSGDQVRQRQDGTVKFLGRGDQQVKVNGYRIELGEIESALLHHDSIMQAVVLVQTNKQGVRVLVAHYVCAPNAEVDAEELRQFLRTHLPEYMIPREFHQHQEFPKTNNGKTDRKALAAGPSLAKPSVPKSQDSQPAATSPVSLGRLELEETLEQIWLDILGLESLSREANFFDLGGHSLLTISLKRILKSQLGLDVPLVALFRHSSIQSLAAFLAVDAGAERAPQKQSAAQKRAALRKARRGRT